MKKPVRRSAWKSAVAYVTAAAFVMSPKVVFAAGLGTQQAQQHFGWMEQLYQMALGVLPLLSLFAIVGGILMWGLGGGNEKVMKTVGPVVASVGVAGFILTSGSFLGIGAASF